MAFEFPWFRFYVKDFFMDANVILMDHAAIGVYLRLLAHQWLEGSIPRDTNQLARIVQLSPEAFSAIWPQIQPCFMRHVRHRDQLVNPRLDHERADALNRSEHNKEAGRKGGLAKAEHLRIAGHS